jgi:hypothetical protein
MTRIELMPDNIFNVYDENDCVIGEYDSEEWTEDEISSLFDE